ncbi:hypothetical protein S14_228 [Shewanella sp. phage 1/4]|uniref:hypothetical protein n=1 Tax=Shewanella phage 1/4 TaxID=1458859 RepID=UPI0004F5D8EE|nr:hypothetical protein S14_228 [Shewanella sp. phage 1/4]AHK11337.1 hypothetical protein S14_228 [Shewanella sp. phage 1/4]
MLSKEQINLMSKSVGHSIVDLKNDIESMGYYPQNESFDKSLTIFNFDRFLLVLDSGKGKSFIDLFNINFI